MLNLSRRNSVFVAICMSITIAGCIPKDHGRNEPQVERETPAKYGQCLADLGQLGAKIESLPDRIYPNGCSATSAVKLVAIGIPVTNLGAMKCGLALPFVEWV